MAAALAKQEALGDADAASWGSMRLSALLAATAARHPTRPAFRDQPGREAWSGRPRLEWSYALAERIAARLAAFFAGLGLKPDSPIGVCLPNGSEAALTILAIEQAGHLPCLIPASWSIEDIERALEATGVQAVVTQTAIGEERPAERFCELAARSFGLRFLCAYGPEVPDGVIDLDRIVLDRPAAEGEPADPLPGPEDPGVITFGRGGPSRPLYRAGSSVVAAAMNLLIPTRIEPGDRILSLVAPDDLRGLATGVAAALVSGATLECHGLFDSPALARALDGAVRTHLVAPGWLEPALAHSGIAAGLASTILVHPAPIRFKAKAKPMGEVVDAVAFDEFALIARARDPSGRPALSLDDDDGDSRWTRDLLRVRRSEDGAIAFSGLAAEVRPYRRDAIADAAPLPEWRESGFKADVFAGIVIGVS